MFQIQLNLAKSSSAAIPLLLVGYFQPGEPESSATSKKQLLNPGHETIPQPGCQDIIPLSPPKHLEKIPPLAALAPWPASFKLRSCGEQQLNIPVRQAQWRRVE